MLNDTQSTGISSAHMNVSTIYYDAVAKVIAIDDTNAKAMKLYNMSGELIAYSNTNRLNVETIQAGVYIIEVEFENKNNVSQKVVIN